MKRGRSKEDYLRLIHELYDEGTRSVDIARNLKISKPSVSEMLRKLAKENLIKIEPYSKIFLTAKGKKQARELSDRHFVIKKFMEKFLNHNEEKAIEEAHELEHALSDESIKIISKLMNLPTEKLSASNVLSYVG